MAASKSKLFAMPRKRSEWSDPEDPNYSYYLNYYVGRNQEGGDSNFWDLFIKDYTEKMRSLPADADLDLEVQLQNGKPIKAGQLLKLKFHLKNIRNGFVSGAFALPSTIEERLEYHVNQQTMQKNDRAAAVEPQCYWPKYVWPSGKENNRTDIWSDPVLKYAKSQDSQLKKLCSEARVLVHPEVIKLIRRFIRYKRNWGSEEEKPIYRNMEVQDWVLRSLRKRPLVFYLPEDHYCLKDEPGPDLNIKKRNLRNERQGGYENVGTPQEKNPANVSNIQTYDEACIAAMLNVSTVTPFFNDGARNNQQAASSNFQGADDQSENLTAGGKFVYTGCVGARFERENVMEHKWMAVTPSQNTTEHGYGPEEFAGTGEEQVNTGVINEKQKEYFKIWKKFYRPEDARGREQEFFDTYDTAESHHAQQQQQNKTEAHCTYAELYGCYLNQKMYKRRLQMSIEPFLLDAQARAVEDDEAGTWRQVTVSGFKNEQTAADREKTINILLRKVLNDDNQENKFLHNKGVREQPQPNATTVEFVIGEKCVRKHESQRDLRDRVVQSIEKVYGELSSQLQPGLKFEFSKEKRKAYVHVVGLGLGAWTLEDTVQSQLMFDTYQDILDDKVHDFSRIGVIDFSYFPSKNKLIGIPDKYKSTMKATLSYNNPGSVKKPSSVNGSAKLSDDSKDWIVVAMYAWDGNAYPGNEFWFGKDLWSASGDPAAACCSAITLTQNPDVNDKLRDVKCVCTWGEDGKIMPVAREADATEPLRRKDLRSEIQWWKDEDGNENE